MDTTGKTPSSILLKYVPELDGWEPLVTVTSDPTPEYNCIAWAANDDTRWWWPFEDSYAYWPDGAPLEVTISAFVKAYETIGYAVCDGDAYEDGYEKIAIYAKDGIPEHAARQVDSEFWTSKLGNFHDVKHPLQALEGTDYGSVAVFMKRFVRSPDIIDKAG